MHFATLCMRKQRPRDFFAGSKTAGRTSCGEIRENVCHELLFRRTRGQQTSGILSSAGA
jgi:hypothetical protein